MIALENFSTGVAVAAGQGQQMPLGAILAGAKLNRGSIERLQEHLAADFSTSGDWFSLCRGLRRKGVCLKFREGTLWLYDAVTHAAVAACEDLGIDPDELELRFGPSQP
ncbi:hypothetical protein [Leisingera thetidis]|uniref:hypothetical protein n=1 Tax=Leisingera thetidis TaxID=2930199 RepID=UPI0021F7AA5C|nr:hypothetical protein [Leisingera thetidis]